MFHSLTVKLDSSVLSYVISLCATGLKRSLFLLLNTEVKSTPYDWTTVTSCDLQTLQTTDLVKTHCSPLIGRLPLHVSDQWEQLLFFSSSLWHCLVLPFAKSLYPNTAVRLRKTRRGLGLLQDVPVVASNPGSDLRDLITRMSLKGLFILVSCDPCAGYMGPQGFGLSRWSLRLHVQPE